MNRTRRIGRASFAASGRPVLTQYADWLHLYTVDGIGLSDNIWYDQGTEAPAYSDVAIVGDHTVESGAGILFPSGGFHASGVKGYIEELDIDLDVGPYSFVFSFVDTESTTNRRWFYIKDDDKMLSIYVGSGHVKVNALGGAQYLHSSSAAQNLVGVVYTVEAGQPTVARYYENKAYFSQKTHDIYVSTLNDVYEYAICNSIYLDRGAAGRLRGFGIHKNYCASNAIGLSMLNVIDDRVS